MSHVMAMAVQTLFPAQDHRPDRIRFYYDFDNPDPFTEADLKAIAEWAIIVAAFPSSASR